MAQLQPRATGAASVTIGVDPHKGSHTAAAVDDRREVVAHLRVPANRAGYRTLRRWASRWPEQRRAVESSSGLGRALTQWLLRDGEPVVNVPAKLSARVRLLSTGHGRKSDDADEVSRHRIGHDAEAAVVCWHRRRVADRAQRDVAAWSQPNSGASPPDPRRGHLMVASRARCP